MSPRPRVEADPEATRVMERISRDLSKRENRQGGLSWGAVVVALFIGYLASNLANKPPTVATVKNETLSQAVATPSPVSTLGSDIAARQSSPDYRPDRRIADPDAYANNGEPRRAIPAYVPRATLVGDEAVPRPVGGLFNVRMPDGRAIHSVVRAPVQNLGNLPASGNQIGDARYVAGDGHWYIWTTPLAGGVATWIDP